jgi:hypothetical protein
VKRGVILAALLALAAPGSAVAQYGGGAAGGDDAAQTESQQGAVDEAQRRRTGLGRRSLKTYEIDDRTSKRLNAARKAFADDDYDGADAALARLRERSLNPLEHQQVYELRAYIAGARGDNAAARQHFESAIAQGTMTPRERADARFMVARLYLADEMWPQAIENLNTWFEIATDPNAVSYYLLALARYQNGEFEAAVEPSQRAVDLTNEPQESWLQLLLALRLTQKEYEASVPLLETLVQRYPKKSYWISLSTVHGALGDYQEALVPLQLAYSQGYLMEDSELRRLAQLLLYLGLPYRAAQVVVDGLSQQRIDADADVYELLGNSWIAAREFEKTVDPLSKAAELAEDGDLFVRLAQVQIAREKWAAAALALRRAIELGDLKKPGDAKLLMGIAVYNSDRPRQARTWFTRARAHEETRNEANQWLLHIEREQQQAS